MRGPEQRTIDVDVQDVEARGKTVHGYAAVYGAEARIGDITETIAAGAFSDVLDHDVRALLNHDPNIVLGRTKSGTLRLYDEARGLRFELDLPESRSDLREAVERRDLDGASFRFVVGDEQWDGDKRTIVKVKELHDVTLATYPAYPAASIELRTQPNPAEAEEDTTMADTATPTDNTEDRAAGGGLQVEDRVTVTNDRPRGLADEFRAAGFPGETATIPWQTFEDRAVTWTGSVDTLRRATNNAAGLGFDMRWAWPAFPRVAVDEGVTSVDVATQTARSLATATTMVRAIDAVTNKPESGSTLTIVSTAMKQVATVQSGIPNVYLESSALNSIVEADLRLALNDALDKLVLDALATSGFQAPGTDPLLVSIRKAITTVQGNGYSPDTLILTPANAEALDVLVSGLTGGTNDYVFGPGNFSTDTIFGLRKRISKTIPAPAVVDSSALGKLYASRVSLARFEENAGKTNTSLVRLETHAVFGTERTAAAVRIAAT